MVVCVYRGLRACACVALVLVHVLVCACVRACDQSILPDDIVLSLTSNIVTFSITYIYNTPIPIFQIHNLTMYTIHKHAIHTKYYVMQTPTCILYKLKPKRQIHNVKTNHTYLTHHTKDPYKPHSTLYLPSNTSLSPSSIIQHTIHIIRQLT